MTAQPPENPLSSPPSEKTKRVTVATHEEMVQDFEAIHEHGALSRTVRRAIYEDTYGRSDSLERRIHELEDKLDSKKRERRELDAQIETIEDEIRKLRERYDKSKVEEELQDDRMETLVETFEQGTRLTSDFPLVDKVAKDHSVNVDEVFDMVRERCKWDAEHVPDMAFRKRQGVEEKPNWRESLDPNHACYKPPTR